MARHGSVYSALAAVAMAVLVAGCTPPTYSVLDELPPPPGPAAATTTTAPAEPTTAPADPAQAEAIPAGWAPTVRPQPWRYIVIHHSATDKGNAASFDKMHREVRGWDELGYHFVITNGNGGDDGAVEIGPRWYKQKWGAHTGGTPDNEYNNFGIGICLVGDFEDHLPSAAQLASLDKLVRFLAERYDVAPRNIIGHCQAPFASTTCPGKMFLGYLDTVFRENLGQLQGRNSEQGTGNSEHGTGDTGVVEAKP